MFVQREEKHGTDLKLNPQVDEKYTKDNAMKIKTRKRKYNIIEPHQRHSICK